MVLTIDLPWRVVYADLRMGVNKTERSRMGVPQVYPASDLTVVVESCMLL
jgi:hypothetical protein